MAGFASSKVSRVRAGRINGGYRHLCSADLDSAAVAEQSPAVGDAFVIFGERSAIERRGEHVRQR